MIPPSAQPVASPAPIAAGEPDPVTGLPDRRRFLDLLAAEVDGLGERPGSVAVLLVDLDGFRRINRDLGHVVGDRLLFSAGRRLLSAARSGDVVARAGGDEFVVMSRSPSGSSRVVDLAESILAAFDDPFDLGVEVITVTASVGVVVSDRPGAPAESLVGDAEAALERNRRGSRRFEVFDEQLRERIRYRAEIGRELAAALAADELAFHYQPIVDIASGRIASVEALARWHHPERGAISPELFVPIAEETGCGQELLERLLDHAAAEFPLIAAADPAGSVSLAINVASTQLTSELLIAAVGELVGRIGVEPRRVVVEISESALTGAADAYLARVSELRALGVRVSLDDFGIASTSIAQLRSLPIDQIKLDRSFVAGLGEASADAALAAGVLPLARALGIEVVAEGIETEGQLAHLFALGYRRGQGYMLARPVAAPEAAALVAAGPLSATRTAETEALGAARESFRQALVAGDAKHAEAVIAEAVAAGIDSIAIQSEVIGRALHWIDSEWEAGRLRAADEHLAAAICERQLAAVIDLHIAPERRFANPHRMGSEAGLTAVANRLRPPV
ncbi:MAG TPA: EAL domain-containing protein [Solirubrobacterales bacterium]|nr:EAL domain-containing protein [Solirubrobacterales bacterium]